MFDFNHELMNIVNISREDKALLRSNLSARLMPEDGQEHMFADMLLPSRPSFGRKAINLLSWCSAPTKVILIGSTAPVRHISVLVIRVSYILLSDVNYKSPSTAAITVFAGSSNASVRASRYLFDEWSACRASRRRWILARLRRSSRQTVNASVLTCFGFS